VTEADWFASAEPQVMLESLRGRLSERKLRLFACACCHHVGWLLTDDRSWDAIVVTERHAAGLATDEELRRASAMAHDAFLSQALGESERLAASAVWGATALAHEGTVFGGQVIARFAINTAVQAGDAAVSRRQERAVQSGLLRCVFGNPFRPAAFDPAWRTSDVLGLARGIYAERAYDRMPILADALQDAGCDSDNVLNHCRGDGPHARGCWVVDLVLQKG
jgi:hypothetical protein